MRNANAGEKKMPRVNFVKKARKDVPNSDIKKGESYYWWKFRYGSKRVSRTNPKRSELTQSSFLSTIWDIEDRISNISEDEDFETLVQDFITEIEELRDETQDSLDNMPDQLQDAPTGQLLQDRIGALEEMITELENVDTAFDEDEIKNDTKENSEIEDDETEEEYQERLEEEIDEAINEKKEEIASEIREICYNGE